MLRALVREADLQGSAVSKTMFVMVLFKVFGGCLVVVGAFLGAFLVGFLGVLLFFKMFCSMVFYSLLGCSMVFAEPFRLEWGPLILICVKQAKHY